MHGNGRPVRGSCVEVDMTSVSSDRLLSLSLVGGGRLAGGEYVLVAQSSE